MTTEQLPHPDSVRKDFIDAYVARWGCTTEYAEGLMCHVERGAVEEEAEHVRRIRNQAEGADMYNRDFYQGCDFILDRMMSEY